MPTDQERLALAELKQLDLRAAEAEFEQAKANVRRAHVRLAKAAEELLLQGGKADV